MSGKELVIPVVLGLLAAGGAYLLFPPHSAPPAENERTDPWAEWKSRVPLFPAPDAPAGPASILVVSTGTIQTDDGHYANGTYTAQPMQPCQAGVAIEFCGQPAARIPIYANASSRPATGPAFDVDGYVVVRTTILIFTNDGRLAYGNADAATSSRFAKIGDYTQVPSSPFYLGNGTAPPGTVPLTAGVQALFLPVRDSLVGLRVGQVATAKVDAQSIEDVYGGPLWATARVEELRQA